MQSVQPPATKPATDETTSQTATSSTSNQTPNTTITGQYTTVTSPPLSALHTSICLLKTAIADISAGSTTVEEHILFDEGVFITQELAETLQLQPTRHEVIAVSTFGEQVSTPKRFAIATICIHTVNGGQIPISVLVVPKLASPVCNSIHAHLHNLPYLSGLTLAHPVTSDENFRISVLIGADHYWEFIEDQVVCGGGPTAVKSRLEYLLSGPLPAPHSIETTNLHISALSCITHSEEAPDNNTLWQIESMGTTPVRQDPDATFMQEYRQQGSLHNLMEPIASSFRGRMLILRSLPTMLYVCAESGLWPNAYRRHHTFYSCTVLSSQTRKPEDSLKELIIIVSKAQFITFHVIPLGRSPLPLLYVLYTIAAANSHLSLQA